MNVSPRHDGSIKVPAAAQLAYLVALLWATPAVAGPPYLTDDPDPTELGHYEIYIFSDGAFAGHAYDGSFGLDLNYGPLDNVQLTATLPLDLTNDGHTTISRGNAEVGVKVRLVNEERSGVSLSVFPRLILPTAKGDGRTSVLLPVWAGWSHGGWSAFGGAGYQIRSGTGTRDSMVEGLALTRAISDRLSIGGEIAHEGADQIGGQGATTLGLGTIAAIGGPFSLLASGGPVRGDRDHRLGFHAYAALGINF